MVLFAVAGWMQFLGGISVWIFMGILGAALIGQGLNDASDGWSNLQERTRATILGVVFVGGPFSFALYLAFGAIVVLLGAVFFPIGAIIKAVKG